MEDTQSLDFEGGSRASAVGVKGGSRANALTQMVLLSWAGFSTASPTGAQLSTVASPSNESPQLENHSFPPDIPIYSWSPKVRCNLHGQGYLTTVGAAWWLSRQPSFSGFRGTKLQGQPEVKCALKEKGSANPPRTRSPGILITGVLEQKVVSITVWVGFGE